MNGIFWRRAFPLFAVTILALNTVNIFTEIQDRPNVHWIYPVIQQYTSALSAIACMPIALFAFGSSIKCNFLNETIQNY